MVKVSVSLGASVSHMRGCYGSSRGTHRGAMVSFRRPIFGVAATRGCARLVLAPFFVYVGVLAHRVAAREQEPGTVPTCSP